MLIALIVSIGTAGYLSIDRLPFPDVFSMKMLMLAAVGCKGAHDLSVPGKLFTILLVISGAVTVSYSLGRGAQFVIEGELRRAF